MAWTIPLTHDGFPSAFQKGLSNKFVVNELDVLWGALTVGRPNLQAVYTHGQYSIDEAIYRLGVVRANLRLDMPGQNLEHSSAFDALDPTEKGWVNFQLGMIFTKIFAAKYLNVPWLLHFKWYANNNPLWQKPGGSTPDFVGQNPITGQYHVLEAKGRVGGFSAAILEKAKEQSKQPVTIAGHRPATRVGALLHRFGKTNLAFACKDPDEDDRPLIELKETVDTWRQYYRLAWDLHNLDDERRSALKRLTGVSIKLVDPVADYVERLMRKEGGEDWKSSTDAIKEWSADIGEIVLRKLLEDPPASRIFADGIELAYSTPDYRLRGAE